eukprot:gene24746-29902_t
MSDAKAKAEARRAKILARDSTRSRTVAAVVELDSEEAPEINLSIGPTTPKERPLAARRSFIRQKTEELQPTEDTKTEKDTETDSDVKDTKTEKDVKDTTSDNNQSKDTKTENSAQGEVEDTTTSSSAKLQLPPKKSLEEVEKEVAEYTQKFDANMTSVKAPKKTTTATATTTTTEETTATTTTTAKDAPLVLQKKKSNVDGAAVMRLVRLLMLVCLAAYTGYRVVCASQMEARTSVNMAYDEFNPSPLADSMASSAEATERTWLQYVQGRIVSQTESSVTAVSLMYYLSRLLTPALTAPLPKKKSEKPLEYIMNLLTNGISNLLEGVYTTIGEVCLHMVVVWVAVCVCTLHFQQHGLPDGAAAEEVKGVEL